MNLAVVRTIFCAMEARGSVRLRAEVKVREAKLMQAQGWVELSKPLREGAGVTARLTSAGEHISCLFKDEAIAQRLRDAFSTHRSSAPF